MTAVSSSARATIGPATRPRERLGEACRRPPPPVGAPTGPAASARPGPAKTSLRAGVAEVVLDLARLEQRVHRHDGAARAEHAVVEDGNWACWAA